MRSVFEQNGIRLENCDCMERLQQMPSKQIDLVVTDIPYDGVNRESNGLRNLNKGNADISTFALDDFCAQLMRVAKGSVYIFCGWSQISPIYQILTGGGMSTRICVWEKTNPSPMNGDKIWLSGLEFCVFGKFSGATFNEFCKAPIFRFASGINKIHDTEKPVELMRELVEASSNKGDLVLDPCAGSASTAIACYRSNRRFIGYEINREYYNKAYTRLWEETAQVRLEL